MKAMFEMQPAFATVGSQTGNKNYQEWQCVPRARPTVTYKLYNKYCVLSLRYCLFR